MFGFMLWLHANFIRFQLDAVPPEDYRSHFDLVKNDLPPSVPKDLDKCLEFTAVHAFVLSFRTRKGPARHTPAGSPEARSSEPRVAPPHSTMKGSIRPSVLGPQTAVTTMVSPYSTFSTLASRYSVSTRPPLS